MTHNGKSIMKRADPPSLHGAHRVSISADAAANRGISPGWDCWSFSTSAAMNDAAINGTKGKIEYVHRVSEYVSQNSEWYESGSLAYLSPMAWPSGEQRKKGMAH